MGEPHTSFSSVRAGTILSRKVLNSAESPALSEASISSLPTTAGHPWWNSGLMEVGTKHSTSGVASMGPSAPGSVRHPGTMGIPTHNEMTASYVSVG